MKDGRTIIICSHNLQELPELCDRILMLNQGRLVLDETIANLQKQGDLFSIFKDKCGVP